MSVQTELQRIIQAKADIIDSIEAKGVTVPSGITIDNLDDYVDQIQGGGPAPEPTPWSANECFYIDLIETNAQYGYVLLYFTQNNVRTNWDALPFTAYYQRTAINGTPSDSNWNVCSDSHSHVPTLLTNDNFRRVWLKIENPLGYKRLINAGTDTNWKFGFYDANQTQITGTGTKVELGGNLMSLLSIYKNIDLPNQAFNNFFSGNTLQINAANLILPNTTSEGCYNSMFSGCTNLTATPALPATTLAPYCYYNMFYGCTAFTTAPSLQATTLANSCYSGMFSGCTALTTAPALPATTLARSCYFQMFNGCRALTTAPVLPATTLAEYCYRQMFYLCTSLTTAPDLPATTLVTYCYNQMFNGCTNLNYVKCLATNISASGCTASWLNAVSATGTFVKDASMSSWTTGTSGIPSGWTVETAAA